MWDCNPAYHMKTEPINDLHIPMEYKNAYEKFSFHILCQMHFDSTCCCYEMWWKTFQFKGNPWQSILEENDCKDIVSILSWADCYHNMSMTNGLGELEVEHQKMEAKQNKT